MTSSPRRRLRRDADDEIFEDAEANLEPMDANFSPEIGAVKSSKLHSAVTAASRGARSNAARRCGQSTRVVDEMQARHRFLCPTDVDGGAKERFDHQFSGCVLVQA